MTGTRKEGLDYTCCDAVVMCLYNVVTTSNVEVHCMHTNVFCCWLQTSFCQCSAAQDVAS